MSKEMQLPEIGEGVTEGELVSWLVKEGDVIDVDQPVAELMTDKATVEVPSPAAGKVTSLKFGEGDVIEVGAVMLTIEEGASEGTKEQASEEKKQEAPKKEAKEEEAPKKQMPSSSTGGQAPSKQEAPAQMRDTSGGSLPPMDVHVLATPSTRRLAREMNVDINNIKGTGLAGRVTREDVIGSQGATGAGQATYSPEIAYSRNMVTQQGKEDREPLKGIRKKIAENMQMAKHVIPHFTLMDEANVTELVQLREKLKPEAEKKGVKVTYMPFVMKALIATIREFPKFNSSIDDQAQEIVSKHYFNAGFAADTPNGLLVPVIKDADHKTIFQLSAEIVDLANRARDGKLKLEEMKGATFTVTNIGSVGGTYATPIINHPEVAIFGMYKIQERPFIVDGELEVGKFMNFTVTCDHRLIDGAEAARFLSAFIKRIENPGVLMMDMI